MILKACLFDLDGVLVDTARYHFLAWKNLANKLGFNFTEADNERLKGVSRMDSLEILLAIGGLSVSEQDKNRYAAEKNTNYLQYILNMTPADVLPGVREFLDGIKSQGILTALGSVSKNAGTILERTDLTRYFDALVDGNLITHAKPDPEVFETGALMLGMKPEECIVFEDAVAGIEAAHRAGMKCVGVGSPQMLKEADLVISGFENLHISMLLQQMI